MNHSFTRVLIVNWTDLLGARRDNYALQWVSRLKEVKVFVNLTLVDKLEVIVIPQKLWALTGDGVYGAPSEPVDVFVSWPAYSKTLLWIIKDLSERGLFVIIVIKA